MKDLKVTKLAAQLTEVREKAAEIKALLAPYEQAEDDLRAQLLAELKALGMGSIRFDGYNFARSLKTTFKVEDAAKAMKWAEKYPVLIKPATVDVAKAGDLLSREMETPQGFTRTDTEFISVRKATTKDEV